MAPLAHRLDVFGIGARRIAFAKVGSRQDYRAARPLCLFSVAFGASAWSRGGSVQSALAKAFTAASGPTKTNVRAELLPVYRIPGHVNWHTLLLWLVRQR